MWRSGSLKPRDQAERGRLAKARLSRVGPLHSWQILLAAIPVLSTVYLLLPESSAARTVAYPVFGLIAMVAVLVGVHRRRPVRAGSWWLIALGLALLSIGDITYSALAFGGQEVGYPSLADLGYLSGYLAFILGSFGLMRGRVAGGDRTPVIDAAILAAGAGSLFWIGIVQPNLQGVVDPVAAAVSLAYPTADLLLLALGLRVLLTPDARPRHLQLYLAGIAFYFISDVIYAMAVLNESYAQVQIIDVGWIAGVLLVGVAALHPSAGAPVASVASSEARLSRFRLALLVIAALVAPILLIIHGLREGDDFVVGLMMEWTILFALVLVRLTTTVDELAASLRLRRRLQVDLAYQAHHDPLTKLANRLLFEMRLGEAMARAPEMTALIFIDLDDFKAINDSMGHAAGDDLLRILAGRLIGGLRGTDLGARLGGDEFAILVEGSPDAAVARAVAERALAILRAPVTVAGHPLWVHASAGVAMGAAGSTATDLMRDADIAMYQAKSLGKDRVEAYEAEMHSRVVLSSALRTELAEAIASHAFVVHYQPIINLETGHVAGAEALVRWDHAVRGLLGPMDFIPYAEASGLIHDLGRWILSEACRTAASWPARSDGERFSISVNLAPSQLLGAGLIDDVAEILATWGLPPDRLILEVTETALVDLEHSHEALRRLRALGVRLALDDFGTGYSTLSYLAALPLSIVKVDRRFTAAIGHGKRDAALLDGILGLCNALGLATVGEGVELPSQLKGLRSRGCQFGQGYLLGRPGPAAQFEAQIADERKKLAAAVPPTPPRRGSPVPFPITRWPAKAVGRTLSNRAGTGS